MKKWNLKLLYLLSLGAPCLLVIAGPVGASPTAPTPTIDSALPFDESLDVDEIEPPEFNWSAPNQVQLSLDVQCLASDCYVFVPFFLSTSNTDYLTVSLDGYSSDTSVTGEVVIPWAGDPEWTVNGSNQIVMTPFNVPMSGSEIMGEFEIDNMAVDDIVNMDDPLTITANSGAVPEPASALLLVGGIALVEFLRRKSRA